MRRLLNLRERGLRLDSFAVLGITVTLRIATVGLQAGIARAFDVTEFNFYVMASIVGALVSVAADLGLTSTVVFTARGDVARARLILASLRQRRIASSLLFWVCGSAFVLLLRHHVSLFDTATAALIVGSYVIQGYSRYLRAPLLAEQRAIDESTLEFRDKGVAILGAAVAMLLTRNLLYVALAQGVGALAGYLIVWRSVPRAIRQPLTWSRPAVQYGLRLSIAVLATQVYARLDYVVLSQFGTARQVAVYAAAYNLILGFSLAPIALTQAAMAHLTNESSEAGAPREYVKIALLTGVVGGIAIAGGGSLAVREVFQLNDPQLPFLCAVLGLAFVLMAANSTIGILGPVTGDENRYLLIVTAALIVNLATCIALIPTIGIMGGAIATLGTEAFVTLCWTVLPKPTHRRLPRQPPIVKVLEP